MLQNGFFLTESHNPDLPVETWTLVYNGTAAGAYSYTAEWGKYRIVYSGGGGSGSSVAFRTTGWTTTRSQENGFKGEEITLMDNVMSGNTKVYSGIIGGGAAGSYTYARTNYHNRYAGTPGTGYQGGNYGTTAGIDDPWQVAAGSGGGSTSLEIDGVLQSIAKGGNGGNASISRSYQDPNDQWHTDSRSTTGGAGGSGGTRTGTGAAGGNASYGAGSSSGNTSGAGATGYVRIYKSNLKPETI